MTNAAFTGLITGESFTITTDFTVAASTFDSVNAGSRTATSGAIALTSSTKASNYSISNTSQTQTGTATINKKALTVTVTGADNKTYDGNTTATTTITLAAFIGSETVTATVTSAFNDKNVDTNKTVTISAITLADGTNGGLAAN